MKNIKYSIIAITVLIALFIWVAECHRQERKDWNKWKVNSLAIIDEQIDKEAQLGRKLTKEEDSLFTDSIRTAWKSFPPKECPYCFMNNLIRECFREENKSNTQSDYKPDIEEYFN